MNTMHQLNLAVYSTLKDTVELSVSMTFSRV